MSKILEREIELLERRVLAQASIVEEMIQMSSVALGEMRIELVDEVVVMEEQVDLQEVHIEEDCLKLLALHQPVAVDLRRVTTMMKVNNDLERIADLAVNVSERAQAFASSGGLVVPDSFDRMVQLTIMMVRSAIDAFVKQDVEIARRVCSQDEEVDSLNREVIVEMMDVMRSASELVEAALYLYSASRYIERIADHATNIAEDVIYLVDGEITRHRLDLNSIAQPN